jgi:hypothetical protein
MHVARMKTGHMAEKRSRHRRIALSVYVADERENGIHFMSNARNTNSSKVLYFAHRKATSKPEKPSRSKENGDILYFAHEEEISRGSRISTSGICIKNRQAGGLAGGNIFSLLLAFCVLRGL